MTSPNCWNPSSVESILMSRFILNLRLLDVQDPARDVSTPSGVVLPTMSLRWPGQSGSGRTSTVLVLDNIGAPLDLDGEHAEDGDEDGPFCHEDENNAKS